MGQVADAGGGKIVFLAGENHGEVPLGSAPVPGSGRLFLDQSQERASEYSRHFPGESVLHFQCRFFQSLP